MEFTITEKQKVLLEENKATTIIFGGARGGGKTFGVSALKMAIDVCEWYDKDEVKKKNIDVSSYRQAVIGKETFYFKYVIDYPDYRGCIVRKTEPALLSNTKVECQKVYPKLGGRWISSQKKYVFPSGAEIYLRPAGREEQLEFFQGQNFQRLAIEELTQFDRNTVEEIEFCCRSTNPYIPARKFYTTNPGKKGHKWVKEKYIDRCPPINDGDPVYLDEFDLTYQPQKAGKYYKTKFGEIYLFIPSLVFDNPFLMENDKNYIRSMLNKNEILRRMWLFGDWNVFAGQFFDMWDDAVHVKSEMEFFAAKDRYDLVQKRKSYDWTGWRLYASNDYGYAEKSAWACGFYAVNDITNDIVKFAEIVESGLSIRQQAKKTKEFLKNYYNLTPDDFELFIADPISYFQRKDKGDTFWTFADVYAEEGIILTKGLNDREAGAGAMIEALRIREDGTPRLTFLDNCIESISSIPNLPASPNNPNDVDTTVFDHPYDENRYFLMVIIGENDLKEKKPKRKSWRDKLGKSEDSGERSWRVA